MRLISKKWTLNQVEQFSHVVQYYISLDNSEWYIFVEILKIGLKCCHTFCRWVLLLPSCATAAVYVYTSAVSYFPKSSLISRLPHFKCTVIFSSFSSSSLYLLPSLDPVVSLLYWKVPRDWRCSTGTRRCSSGVWGTWGEGTAAAAGPPH